MVMNLMAKFANVKKKSRLLITLLPIWRCVTTTTVESSNKVPMVLTSKGSKSWKINAAMLLKTCSRSVAIYNRSRASLRPVQKNLWKSVVKRTNLTKRLVMWTTQLSVSMPTSTSWTKRTNVLNGAVTANWTMWSQCMVPTLNNQQHSVRLCAKWNKWKTIICSMPCRCWLMIQLFHRWVTLSLSLRALLLKTRLLFLAGLILLCKECQLLALSTVVECINSKKHRNLF